MEGIFQLSPVNPVTVASLEDILVGKLNVKYTPLDTVSPGVAPETAHESNLTAANITTLAMGLGSEVPAEITRLFLLVQANALVRINRGILNAAVSRLLDFYQYDIFPQVFTQGLFATPTAHLLQPVFGAGKVYYQGYLLQSADIHDIFSWQPVAWPSVLPSELKDDSSFGLSYLVYSLSQFKKIYRFAQVILPDIVNNRQILFWEQIDQLTDQLDQALAQSHHQSRYLAELVDQLKKLLAKFGEHLVQDFGQCTPSEILVLPISEKLRVAPAYMVQLIETLAGENLFLYESGSSYTHENTTEPTLRLLVQPYHLLQNLEQLMALITIIRLTDRVRTEAQQNIPSHLPELYRDQVLNVLPGTAFDELIRSTIAFMYATA